MDVFCERCGDRIGRAFDPFDSAKGIKVETIDKREFGYADLPRYCQRCTERKLTIKVYIVVVECYPEDHTIRGVFDNRPAAEQYAAKQTITAFVEEWPVDSSAE